MGACHLPTPCACTQDGLQHGAQSACLLLAGEPCDCMDGCSGVLIGWCQARYYIQCPGELRCARWWCDAATLLCCLGCAGLEKVLTAAASCSHPRRSCRRGI
jgi:hypothetical protein